MKHLTVALFIISISSCSICDMYNDQYYSMLYSDIELYYGDFTEIETPSQIHSWMTDRISYRETDTILSPKEILSNFSCDCDGFAVLYMNIAYVRFGIKPSLCLVNESRAIVSGGEINHTVVKVGNDYYSPQSGNRYSGKIGYQYDFEHVFNLE